MTIHARLRPKLVASYVALGICITLFSLLGGRYIQSRAVSASAGRADLLHRATEVALLTSSAAEEGFSFVLAGEPREKESALSKLDMAAAKARDLQTRSQRDDEEQVLLTQVVSAVDDLRSAAAGMFESYERSGELEPGKYSRYDAALDAMADRLEELHSFSDTKSAREADRARRRSDWLTVLIGLFGVLVAVGAGVAFADRVTKPVLALRDVVTAFGAGELHVLAPMGSGDEIGELGEAFDTMMTNTRLHIETIGYGQRRLQDIFASIDEILVVCDEVGTVVVANPACCKISGFVEHEIIGKPVAFLFPGVRGPGDAGSLAVSGECEGALKTASGQEVPVSLTRSKLHGQAGNGWVWVAQDLTQRRHLEAELRQAQKLEAIGRLAGGVAHDFNNMLSVVLGYTTMLLDGLSPSDPTYLALCEVRTAGERSADLTKQLLAFSRQEPLETHAVDLNEIAANTLRMVRRVLGEDINVTHTSGSEACITEVEPGQIEQVLMNLAVNARDAMPRGGKLTVETSITVVSKQDASRLTDVAAGRYATLIVKDDGTGMDAATRERIFEPFFTTKEQGKGTGLGLSTVFGIVHRCRGHIRVESEIGRGTTFSLFFPEARRDAPVYELRRASSNPQPIDATILLVEDEEAVRTLVSRILRRKGYHVLIAKDPREALSICDAATDPIELLLTDVMMPQMNGRELARRILVLRPHMKVLYMSGYTDDVAFDEGVRDTLSFLEKPIRPDTLARKVREALTRSTPHLAA